ncbi:alpha/beta fold hydrolase [Burkholderia sp. MSMB1835]|uniref:alpha/beta fold hydrolase n=1 Tax=Burkholderia sp. MSMB1835 TaxID=1637876 RepID=UPI000758632D|nr:alpha/beta hydrolase [Burkholderia sp. MSMB1835]KVL30857.1 alpha/beta hydrolase [Burkholderia sp. MSMB1835]
MNRAACSSNTMDVTRGVFDANGVEIHYLRQGSGPLVICSHGFPDHAGSFLPLVAELAEAGFTAVAPYLRGYAPSSAAPPDQYHTCYMACDLKALIDELGFEQAILVGHDWGAQASIAAAILFPERVAKLVALGWSRPDAAQRLHYDYLKGIWHTFFFQSPSAEQVLAHDDFAFIEAWWRDASRNWDVPRDTIESVKATFRQPGVLEAALAQYRCRHVELRDPERRDQQARIAAGPVTVPTLLMHGTHDREGRLEAFTGDGVPAYFSAALTREIVEGAGHFLHLEKSGDVNQSIIDFIVAPS